MLRLRSVGWRARLSRSLHTTRRAALVVGAARTRSSLSVAARGLSRTAAPNGTAVTEPVAAAAAAATAAARRVATPSAAAHTVASATGTSTASATAATASAASTGLLSGLSSFNVLNAKRRFTTIGLNGAVEALHNGILEKDDYYRKGLPASKFTLSLGSGGAVVAGAAGAASDDVKAGSAAAVALREKLYSILSAHRHVDPFAIVENDLKQLTASIKSIIGSDHPVLMAVAKYFFEVSGKRIRPTILLLVARALSAGLDPASAEASALATSAAPANPNGNSDSPRLLSHSFRQRIYTSHTAAPSPAVASASARNPSPHVPLTPFDSPNYPNATVTVGATAASASASASASSSSAASASASASASAAALAAAEGPVSSSQKTISEITEMIHTASLLHDDVVDNAKTRRGVSSLNAVFGNKVAILGGDFLLARASVSLARLRDPYVTELLSLVIEHLVKGEIMQAKPLVLRSGRLWENLELYLTKTYYKTASLMAHSCKAVAVLGGHDHTVQDIAYEFGKSIGLAFQIVDDLLDFESSALTLGKPAHNDLASGVVTAPVLFAAEQYPELRDMLQRKFDRPGDIERALEFVHKSGGIERARELARSCVADAVAAVLQLNPSRSRSALIALCEIVLSRDK